MGKHASGVSKRPGVILQALVGSWIGGTMLLFLADGSFYAGGASLLDWPLHGGRWSIDGDTVKIEVDPLPGGRNAVQQLVPYGRFACGYVLRAGALRLSDCPYVGDYSRLADR